jgi:hypothetical protein
MNGKRFNKNHIFISLHDNETFRHGCSHDSSSHSRVLATSDQAGKMSTSGLNQANKSKFWNWKVGGNYSLEKILGHGSYGEVASAIHKPTGKKVDSSIVSLTV